jgi:phosphate-selective porin OprO/OprP
MVGPTWDDFHALAQRLQETEQRLNALGGEYPLPANARYQDTYAASRNQPPLASETQIPPEGILSRLAALEESVAADKPRLPSVRISGFAQLDQGLFNQSAGSRASVGDIQNGIGFRRARIQAVGNVAEFTRYNLEMDFATAGRPSFLDVWAEQTNMPFLGNVRIGHFRQPTSMDCWTSIRHLEFLERSLPFQAFDPFRRVGIMSWYNTGEDDRTLIAYSLYATGFTFTNPGASSPVLGTIGDTRYATQIGDNGGVSAAIRASHLLLYDPYADNRYLLHIGGGYNFSEIGGSPGRGSNARTYEARAIPEFFVGDPGNALTAIGTPFVADTGRFLANDFHYMHTELAANYGSAHFQTEYMATLVDQLSGPQVFYHGAYIQGGYFLTGESCGYNKQLGALDYNVKPFREFFALGRDQWFCGFGAWEVAARFSYINLASTNILPANQLSAAAGPPPSPNPGIVNDTTLALNWWWSQYIRVQFNYIYCATNPNLAASGATNICAARFQFEF